MGLRGGTAAIRFWLLALLLLAAGCAPETARWSAAESPKENRVDFVALTHPIRFARASATVSAGEQQALAEFLSTVAVGYGDEVTVDRVPRDDRRADALATRRQAAVAAALRRLRVRASAATRRSVDGVLDPDVVLVRVGRYVVTGPRCPDWRNPEAADASNAPPSNFGCATQTNLGQMVANPADLVRGAPEGAADGSFAARGVELYRAGEISKSLQPQSDSSAGSGTGGPAGGSGSGGSGGGG